MALWKLQYFFTKVLEPYFFFGGSGPKFFCSVNAPVHLIKTIQLWIQLPFCTSSKSLKNSTGTKSKTWRGHLPYMGYIIIDMC